ncbi:MAG TPA: Ig-like domain-containing protein [Longimicrobium sp.]
MSRRIFPVTLAVLMLAGAACEDAPTGPARTAPAEIRVTPDSVALRLGQTATLTASVLDAHGQPLAGVRVRFSSSRPDVAEVDSVTGVVTGVAAGTAGITAASFALQTTLPVVVAPAGGAEVHYLHLEGDWFRFDVLFVPTFWYGLRLDTWNLITPILTVSMANAAGENLCGIVPLTLTTDSTVLSVRYHSPCRFELHPHREGRVWLTGHAGAIEDRLEVVVHRTKFRWVFGPAAGPYVAGGQVQYEFAVVDEHGAPVPGVPVVFGWRERDPQASGVDSALTGPDGFARATVPLPARPVVEEIPHDFGLPSVFVPAFRVDVSATLPDGRAVGDSSRLEVSPGAPDHIEVLALRSESDMNSANDYPYGSYSASRAYRVLSGDEVVLRKYSAITTAGSWTRTRRFVDSLAVIVADRLGNPTEVLATAAADGSTPQTWSGGFKESSYRALCSWTCRFPQESFVRHRTGLVVFTSLGSPFDSIRLTISATGVPTRTVTVVGVDSIP